mgnify:CR=1 FL=1
MLCIIDHILRFVVYCVAAAVGKLMAIAPEIAAHERHRLQEMGSPEDFDGDGRIGVADYCAYIKHNILYQIGWVDNKARYRIWLALLFWIVVGILYGLYYEEFDLADSVYFTFDTLVEMALSTPTCYTKQGTLSDEDCEFGVFRGIFLSLYIQIGCPLFALSVAHFAGIIIEATVRQHEKEILHTPLTEEEYQFASNLYGEDELLNLGEFTILELLRLQRVSMEDLRYWQCG